jgi:hypothetical protein
VCVCVWCMKKRERREKRERWGEKESRREGEGRKNGYASGRSGGIEAERQWLPTDLGVRDVELLQVGQRGGRNEHVIVHLEREEEEERGGGEKEDLSSGQEMKHHFAPL